MVFGGKFDKALWLVMAYDKENRDKIAEFIKMIPEDVYSFLHKKIQDYKYYAVVGHSKACYFEPRKFKLNDGFICDIKCGLVFGQLEIKICKYNMDDSIHENYILSLTALDDCWFPDKINEIVYGGRELGAFSYNLMESNKNDRDKIVSVSKVYGIVKKNSKVVKIYPKDSVFEIGKRISLNRCPDEVYVEDFGSKDRVNKLIKCRRKR